MLFVFASLALFCFAIRDNFLQNDSWGPKAAVSDDRVGSRSKAVETIVDAVAAAHSVQLIVLSMHHD